jgi:hypothetical protein
LEAFPSVLGCDDLVTAVAHDLDGRTNRRIIVNDKYARHGYPLQSEILQSAYRLHTRGSGDKAVIHLLPDFAG